MKSLFLKSVVVALATLTLVVSNANASPINWTNWSSAVSGTSSTGFAIGSITALDITVTYEGQNNNLLPHAGHPVSLTRVVR